MNFGAGLVEEVGPEAKVSGPPEGAPEGARGQIWQPCRLRDSVLGEVHWERRRRRDQGPSSARHLSAMEELLLGRWDGWPAAPNLHGRLGP